MRRFGSQRICVPMLSLVLVAGGCATYSRQEAVPWLTTTNACAATFVHVWSDRPFNSQTAAVPVTIVLPRASWVSRDYRSRLQAADYAGAAQARDNQAAMAARRSAARDETAVAAASEKLSAAAAAAAAAAVQGERRDAEAQSGNISGERHAQVQQAVDQSGATMEAVRAAAQSDRAAGHARDEADVAASDSRTAAATARNAGHRAGTVSDEAAGWLTSAQRAATRRERTQTARQQEGLHASEAKSDDFSSRSAVLARVAGVAANASPSSTRLASAASVSLAREALPELVIEKSVDRASVLAGRRVEFTIRLANAGHLDIDRIFVHDPVPPHLTCEGLRHGFWAHLFPGLRRVTPVGSDGFAVHGLLRSGEAVSFRIAYRAAAPPVHNAATTAAAVAARSVPAPAPTLEGQ